MSSTAECITAINAEDVSKFANLITKTKTDWKRVNKFNYREGIRRYFYLVDSCLIATVDSVAGRLYAKVRPPMLWEIYMLQDLRPKDRFLDEDIHGIFDKYYDLVTSEAAKGSEAQQYDFMIGNDDGGWVFFNPIHYKDVFDQHLNGDLHDLLPSWMAGDEVMECTYAITLAGSRTLEDIKKELIDLGFVYNPEEM